MMSKGKIEVTSNLVFVRLSHDFTNYYNWLIQRRYWKIFNTPRRGAHITIWNKSFHSGDHKRFQKYSGKEVSFEYNIENLRVGGKSKGFINFWIPVKSKEISDICQAEGVKTNKYGLHVTISSNKKLDHKDYFPPILKIGGV